MIPLAAVIAAAMLIAAAALIATAIVMSSLSRISIAVVAAIGRNDAA